MNPSDLQEYRCGCGKLLFKGLLIFSKVEIKCKRCGEITVFEGKSKEEALNFLKDLCD